MRILLVSESYTPLTSGVSTVVDSYAQMLHKCNNSVSVITANNYSTSSVTINKGVRIYRIKSIRNYLRPDCPIPIPRYEEIKKIIEKERPDIIHVHTIATLALFVQHVAKRMRIPIVATVHGIPPWILTYIPFPKPLLSPLEYILWIFLVRYLNATEHVTAPSLYVKRELVRHGVKTACSIIPMWISPPEQTTKHIRLQNFHCDPSTTYYCFIGRLDPDKNISFLMDAWIRFQNQHTNAQKKQLLIIGPGTQTSYLKRLAANDPTHSIVFLGKYEEKQLFYFYDHGHFFCMPALYETQSIVTLQAIAAGKIVLLAGSGALREIKQRYPKHVLLYKPNNQDDLVRCFKAASKLSRSRILPKPNMEFYSQQKISHQLLALYETAITTSS